MAPFYKSTCEMLDWPIDEAWLAAMEAANKAELDSLVEKLANAEQNEGESEICEALLTRAEFNMRIGEKEKTIEAFEETYAKTVGLGPKLDLLLSKLRVCLFIEDVKLVSSTIERWR